MSMDPIQFLGLSIQTKPWTKEKLLPLYITNTFWINKAEINGVSCLRLVPKGQLPSLPALQKQIQKIQAVEALPVYLELDSLSFYRKNALLNQRIPFLVKNKQAYLPFMGTVLIQESSVPKKPLIKLTPAAQLLFFWILYQNRTAILFWMQLTSSISPG